LTEEKGAGAAPAVVSRLKRGDAHYNVNVVALMNGQRLLIIQSKRNSWRYEKDIQKIVKWHMLMTNGTKQ